MTSSSERPVSQPTLKEKLRFYYEAEHPRAHLFRYGLLAFDITTVLFIVISSFFERTFLLEVVDLLFGMVILADFAARFYISRNRWQDLRHPATWADVVAIFSFLIPMAGEGAAFLRALRTVRLLQTYEILVRLRADSAWFRRNEDLTITLIHLVVFLFVMSGLVYELQRWINPQISRIIWTCSTSRSPHSRLLALATSRSRAQPAVCSPSS